jgi:hypothetical protein
VRAEMLAEALGRVHEESTPARRKRCAVPVHSGHPGSGTCLDGATVVDVARRNGVVRPTVHDWLRRYAAGGLAGLADGVLEAAVVSPPSPAARRSAARCRRYAAAGPGSMIVIWGHLGGGQLRNADRLTASPRRSGAWEQAPPIPRR